MEGEYFFISLGVISLVLFALDRYKPPTIMFPLRMADKETFENDFAPYRDKWGMIQNNPGGSSRNGLSYSSLYYILKFRYGLLTKEDVLEFCRIVRSCESEPGLLNRSPEDKGQQGLDDYIAVCTASRIMDLNFPEQFKIYGLKHWSIFNNENPGHFTLRAWFGRYPALLAHFYYSADDVPSWFKTSAWFFSIVSSALTAKGNQDEWVLSSHLIISYEWSSARTWPQDWVCRFWRKKFKAQWGDDGMSKLLERYFGHRHPLSKYAIDI